MSKEEIREGISSIALGGCPYPDDSMPCEQAGESPDNDNCLRCILEWLDKLGVVIKVRGKLPLVDGTFENFSECGHPYNFHEGYWKAQKDMKKAGYVYTERLI